MLLRNGFYLGRSMYLHPGHRKLLLSLSNAMAFPLPPLAVNTVNGSTPANVYENSSASVQKTQAPIITSYCT